MDFSWLPTWQTGIALGTGLGGVFYSTIRLPAAASPDFQEKWVKGIPLLVGSLFIALPMWVTGGIFLAYGWHRSPWEWSIVGLAILLWVPVATWSQWTGGPKQRPASTEPPEAENPPSGNG